LGHRKLLEKAVEAARQGGNVAPLPVAVWSFSALPKASTLLTTREETAELLAECGVDWLVLADFDQVSELDGEAFFKEQLQQAFSPAAVVCGFNFRFGVNGGWCAADLLKMGEQSGVPVYVVPQYTDTNGEIISSTRIRMLIQNGDMETAAYLMGSPYRLTASVEHGKKLGRTIGFPTINQRMPSGKVIPAHGIYISRVSFTDKDGIFHDLPGVCNIGFRPTVNNDTADITLETYILRYQGDLYGTEVQLSLYKKIRDEQKFPNMDTLSQQIVRDAEAAMMYFADRIV